MQNPYLFKMKAFFALCWLVLAGGVTSLGAQGVVEPKQLDYSSAGILYESERAFDFRPHSNGIAFGLQVGRLVTYYKTRYYTFDFGFLKHPKEFRQSISFNSNNPFSRNANSFTYGKQNQFFVLRGGIGGKRYFSDKAKRKGVAVGMNYEFGASIGLLKPYYLDLFRLRDNGFTDYISTEKYSEENQDLFLDDTKIVGPGPFFKGFGELTAIPGLHARVGAHFSLGSFDEFVKAVEIGIMVDGFFRRVPIMIIENNTPVFINGYLSLQLGKRS